MYIWQSLTFKLMNAPENLYYTKEHEWVKIDGEYAYAGITDFAQKELGDIVYIEVETIGENISQGEAFGTIEAVKTVSDLFMPISGEIIELNPAIGDAPEIINNDPYEKGWIIKFKIAANEEVQQLMTAAQYLELTGE